MKRVDFGPDELVQSVSILVGRVDDPCDSFHNVRPKNRLLVRVYPSLVNKRTSCDKSRYISAIGKLKAPLPMQEAYVNISQAQRIGIQFKSRKNGNKF